MNPLRLRFTALAALLAAAPAAAQSPLFDFAQNASENAAATAAQATTQAQQTVAQTRQAAWEARNNPAATAQAALGPTTPASPAAPAAPAGPATNCSGANSPQQFRACLTLTQHQTSSWKAQHPTVAQQKSDSNSTGYGGKPTRITPPVRTQN